MFRLLRSVGIKLGADMEAVQVAQEIAEYINKNYSQTNVQVCTPVFSDLGRVVWFADYENLTVIEEMDQKLIADEGYLALVSKLVDKVIEGSGKDELFQAL